MRLAVIWSDRRAVIESAELTDRLGRHAAFTLLPQLLWLKRYERINYHRTRWVLSSFEYISYKLTHQPAYITSAGQLPHWSAGDIETVGVDPGKFPLRGCRLGEVYGLLAPDVASDVGLPRGLPVVAGTVDAFAAWIGTATLGKGTLCNTAGTSDGVAVVWERPLADLKGRVHSVPHITGRNWIIGGAMSGGGAMLDWFVRRFYDHAHCPHELIAAEADSVPAGAGGIVALPYLAGERSPISDPHARGVFFGIAEKHTRAHLARAVLESVAFAVRDVCEVIREVGAEIEEVRVAGGAARNGVWNQIRADVLGRPVLVPEIIDASLLGAAIIAGWGVRRFEELSDAARMMVRFHAPLEPNPAHHAVYTRFFEFYRGLYAHLKDDFSKLHLLNAHAYGSDADESR